MVKRKPSVHCPTCREHGTGEGSTGSAFDIPTKLQQSNLAHMGRLGCRVQASPLIFKYVSKLAVLPW